MVLLAELSGRYLFKQSQSFLASFDFGVAARRCHSFAKDGVMYDHSSKDTGWGSIHSREFTRFEAVVGTSIFVRESVVQVRLYMGLASVNDSRYCYHNIYRGASYSWMFIGKSIVDGHVMEERLDIFIEECFNHFEAELRIDKHRSKVRFDHVRQALYIS